MKGLPSVILYGIVFWVGMFLFGIGLGLLIVSCDSGDTSTEIIECQLPPGHCQMDDEEFDVMFNALTLNEQTDYIEEWGQPQDQRKGFVSQ